MYSFNFLTKCILNCPPPNRITYLGFLGKKLKAFEIVEAVNSNNVASISSLESLPLKKLSR